MADYVWAPLEKELFDRMARYYHAYYRDTLGLPDWQERTMSRLAALAYNHAGLVAPQDVRDLAMFAAGIASTPAARADAMALRREMDAHLVRRDRTLAKPPLRPWWLWWWR